MSDGAPRIPGGYVLLARKLQHSRIWTDSPPTYVKLWLHLLLEAEHRPKDTAAGRLERGQVWTTYARLQGVLSHKVGFRQETPSKSVVGAALRRMREAHMIETMKTTRGIVITVVNYSLYQNPANYERNDEETTKHMRRGSGIDKKLRSKKKEGGVARAHAELASSVKDELNERLAEDDEAPDVGLADLEELAMQCGVDSTWVSRFVNTLDFPPSWVKAALEAALLSKGGRVSANYIHGILKRYLSEGGPDDDDVPESSTTVRKSGTRGPRSPEEILQELEGDDAADA